MHALEVHQQELLVQSSLVIRTTFVPLCFSEKNVLITSEAYECSYNQRNYLVFWKSVLRVQGRGPCRPLSSRVLNILRVPDSTPGCLIYARSDVGRSTTDAGL